MTSRNSCCILIFLDTENLPNVKPGDIGQPDLPAVNELEPDKRQPEEPLQIKGPVGLPESKKEEEVQLDRPDAGKETEPRVGTRPGF